MQLCTSKHTSSIILSVPACIRSLARCPEFKVLVVVVMDESPRQARQARQASLASPKAKAVCNDAKHAKCTTTPASRRTIQALCTVKPTSCRITHSCECSLYQIRRVLGIFNGCSSRNRHILLDVDLYILDFLHASTHTR